MKVYELIEQLQRMDRCEYIAYDLYTMTDIQDIADEILTDGQCIHVLEVLHSIFESSNINAELVEQEVNKF